MIKGLISLNLHTYKVDSFSTKLCPSLCVVFRLKAQSLRLMADNCGPHSQI